MKKLSRREAIGTIITGSAGITLAGITNPEAQTTAPAAVRAFAGQHQSKPLPFDSLDFSPANLRQMIDAGYAQSAVSTAV